ncbi:hypothetical protein ACNQFN_15125 [Thauera butanivorans]|uniref:hypothetical protein n=1 Tax=Thauera butanivorans TaxID=86174 RepID=UPI003AB518AB
MVSGQRVVEARLSIQRALLGEVSPHLRAVVLSVDCKKIDVHFYFDGDVSEEDEESVSCIETEILADFEPDFSICAEVIRLDYPLPISDDGFWVYQRKERAS